MQKKFMARSRKPRTVRTPILGVPKKREPIPVHVVYASSDTSVEVALFVSPGSSIRDAVKKSSILKIIKNVKLEDGLFCIGGEPKPADTVLKSDDRIEIFEKPS